MGLYVSTTGTDVSIPELGFTLVHPSTDYALSDQFSVEDIQGSTTLTSVIRAGTLTWKKTSGGSTEVATDYDPDYLEADTLNTGVGSQADRVVTFKDLSNATLKIKSGIVLGASFTLNPKRYTVVFATPFPDNNYVVLVLNSTNPRTWTWESHTASGFVLNSNANAALTGNVTWAAMATGETS